MASGNYYSSPSGREILSAKLDAIVEDHNQQVEEEAKVSLNNCCNLVVSSGYNRLFDRC